MASTFREVISENAFHGIAYPMIVLPTLFICARVGLQIWKRKGMEIQDYLIYFAFICFLAMSISYLKVIPTIYAVSKVRAGLIRPWANFNNDRTMYIRMMFVTNTLFWLCLWSVKLSLLGLYKKLLKSLPLVYIRLWWAVCGFLIISLIGCIISYTTSCPNFGASLSSGECSGPRSIRGQLASLYMSYAVDVLSDIMIMALPIKLVWNLQMARGQKIAIIALFTSGFVCIAFATLRVAQIGVRAGNDASPSPTWLALWTIIESAMAVCIGCGPAFGIIYRASRITQPSYDTQGYVRQDASKLGGSRSRPDATDIKLTPVNMGVSRSGVSRNDAYWDDATSSQEELAADTKGIVVTTTVEQDSQSSNSRMSPENISRNFRSR